MNNRKDDAVIVLEDEGQSYLEKVRVRLSFFYAKVY